MDAMFPERIPERQQDLAADVGQPALRVADPEAQLEFQRRVPERGEPADRGAVAGGNAAHRSGRLDGDARDLVGIGVVGDPEGDVEANVFVGERPVDDFGGNEVLVGYEKLPAIARDHRDEAGAKLANPAEGLSERDRIARLDGLVHEDDDPGNEVGDDFLQSEADTDTDGTRQDGQCRKVDSESRHRHHRGDDDQRDAQDLADQDAQRRGQVLDLLDAPIEEVAHRQRQPQQHAEEEYRLQHAQQRQAERPDGEARAVEQRPSRRP